MGEISISMHIISGICGGYAGARVSERRQIIITSRLNAVDAVVIPHIAVAGVPRSNGGG